MHDMKDEFYDFFDVIVVIGHANDLKGALSPIAEARLKKGIELFEAGRAPYIILTSGRGQFNQTKKAHSEWAKKNLLEVLPLTPNRVITETKSRSTIENALHAKKIIDKRKWSKLIVVTSGYHMSRTKMIFRRVFPSPEYAVRFTVSRRGYGPLYWLKHRLKEMVLKQRNKKELKGYHEK